MWSLIHPELGFARGVKSVCFHLDVQLTTPLTIIENTRLLPLSCFGIFVKIDSPE